MGQVESSSSDQAGHDHVYSRITLRVDFFKTKLLGKLGNEGL